MAHEITRRLEIDAGHRLVNHESKCASVHGHRYAFEITVSSEALDSVGRVIDFGDVKEIIGGWLDANWDHAMIFQWGDPLLPIFLEHNQKVHVMERPPTAENLAMSLLEEARRALSLRGIVVLRVRCYETPNCWADAF